jgi:hypothetical protein
MDAFTNFLTKGVEFYLAAPAFFNWSVPAVFVGIGGITWLAYWLGGKFADSEVRGLRAQVAALDQRFNLANSGHCVALL